MEARFVSSVSSRHLHTQHGVTTILFLVSLFCALAPVRATQPMYATIKHWPGSAAATARSGVAMATATPHAAPASNPLVFVAGGYLGTLAGTICKDTVDIYDVSTAQWTQTNLSLPFCTVSAVGVGSRAFVAGSQWPNSYYTNAINVFDTSAWPVVRRTVWPLPTAIFTCATTIGTFAVFAGEEQIKLFNVCPALFVCVCSLCARSHLRVLLSIQCC